MTRATRPGERRRLAARRGRYFVRVTNFNPSRSVGGYEGSGVFPAGAGSPQERFESTVAHRIGDDQARSVALGDVTGDGLVNTVLTAEDLAEDNDDKLFVFAGNAAGYFDPPVALPAPGTSERLGLALADLDGDGAKDAAVAAGGTCCSSTSAPAG